jgi:cell division protein ZapA
MASVNVTINGRSYRMACDDGQEDHLRQLAEDFDRRIAGVKKDLGEIGDTRLTVVAALMMADELSELGKRVGTLEKDLADAIAHGAASGERSHATQGAIVAALNSASERIESVTKDLNRSLTDSVPMG